MSTVAPPGLGIAGPQPQADPWIIQGPWLSYPGGLVLGGATGGYLGVGTINARNVYVNGQPLGSIIGAYLPITGGTVAGNLTVTGTTTLAGMSASGTASFGNTLSATGAVTFNSTLSVTGASTLTGAVSLGNDFSVAGTSTLTGDVTFGSAVFLHADPTAPLGAATKQYTDTKLSLAGGTLTGPLNLAADPTAALGASTKQYVDNRFLSTTVVYPNRIINGDMAISQRILNATRTLCGFNPVDLWFYYGVGTRASNLTYGQNYQSITTPAGFPHYLGFKCTTGFTPAANDVYYLAQAIEADNCTDLLWGTVSARPITLNFWVNASATGNYGATISNSGRTRVYPFSYNIASANTWTNITVTIPGDTSGTWVTSGNGAGLVLTFGLVVDAGKAGTANAWTSTSVYSPTGCVNINTLNATFYVTGVKLEAGSTYTGWAYQTIDDRLKACQRFFCKTYDQGTAIQTAGQTVTAVAVYTGPTADTTSKVGVVWKFPVTMRMLPTFLNNVAMFSPSTGSQGWAYSVNAAADISGLASNYISDNQIFLQLSGANLTARDTILFHASVDVSFSILVY